LINGADVQAIGGADLHEFDGTAARDAQGETPRAPAKTRAPVTTYRD